MISKLILISILLLNLKLVNSLIKKQEEKSQQCPDETYNFQNMNSECMKKHQFFCMETMDLKCRILNRDFNCKSNQFCPTPIETIINIMKIRFKKVASMNMPQLFGLEYKDLEIYVKNEDDIRNGSLNLPSTFIELLNNVSLQYLTLNNLNMTYLPLFQNLSLLKRISISENNLETLESGAFHNLKDVDQIDLPLNKLKFLSKFTFSDLPLLQYLDLSYNLLTSIQNETFNNLPSLKDLKLLNNQIQTVDPYLFAHSEGYTMTRLKNLDLTGNKIRNLFSFNTLQDLEFLVLSNNELRIIDCSKLLSLTNLEILELDSNQIENFKCDLEKLPELFSISLKSNRLTSLFKSSFHSFLSQPRSLAIKDNPLNCSKVVWLTELKTNFLSSSKGNCTIGYGLNSKVIGLSELKKVNDLKKIKEDESEELESNERLQSSSFKSYANCAIFFLSLALAFFKETDNF